MTNEEFDLIDNLYFIKSYQELFKECDFEENTFKELLISLINKGWVRGAALMDGSDHPETQDILNNLEKHYFVASKEGLMRHNLG